MADRILNSLRVAYENWLDADRFNELISLLKKYPCGISQVALFTSSVHTPLKLAELTSRAAVMKDRLALLRREGFPAGINILATAGHHNEDLGGCFTGPYHRSTNDRGETCRGSFCLGDKDYIRDYVVPAYTILAKAAPDFIWIDDDIRLSHLPTGQGCFCDGCLDRFNREHGMAFTREELVQALDLGDRELRLQWLGQNTAIIEELLSAIGKAVRAVDDGITLGLMTGERYPEGYDLAGWADALSDGGRYQIMWRPGGGAYDDRCFDNIIAKASEIGRQNARLPEYVFSIQSEVENFPYQLIDKSPRSTALEAAVYMTSGCTGAAFNILPSETGEPLDIISGHLEAIDSFTPLYKLLNEKTAGLRAEGIHSLWRPDAQAAVPPGRWTQSSGGMYGSYARSLFETGLPECWDAGKADVFTMTGREAELYSDEELRDILSRGVYMDAGALDCLNARGMGEYTGLRTGREIPADARERYLPSSFNEGFAGGLRNCRQAFYPGDSYELIPVFVSAEPLSELVDYHGRVLAPCSLGVFENSLGGRVCVSGYYPFTRTGDRYKTAQLRRIFLWLSQDGLPSYVRDCKKLRNITLTGGGRMLMTLLNAGSGSVTGTTAVRTDAAYGVFYDRGGRKRRTEAAGRDGAYALFPFELGPADLLLLEIKEKET